MALAMDEFRRLLADRGYRVTAQRLAIYELLQENARRSHHPSAEELYQQARERFPMISPATVYNTLELLVELGLASQLGFPGDVQRYDGNPHAHANVQCIDCKAIFDVDAGALEGIGQRVAERSEFVILGQRFEFYGICPRCRERRARDGVPVTEGAAGSGTDLPLNGASGAAAGDGVEGPGRAATRREGPRPAGASVGEPLGTEAGD
ncbi:Fur family transcriptional regulator [Thermaerobacter litoralis]